MMMSSFRTIALVALFLAVPSSSFTTFLSAPYSSPKQHEHKIAGSSRTAASTEFSSSLATTSYDPSDAFNTVSPLQLGLLEEEENDNDDGGDILLDLHGSPLSTAYFRETMGIDNVDSYTVDGEFRGLMSDACRVHLWPGGETAFYKHVVFSHLGHAQEKLKSAPHKLQRDAKSYQVVASFLLSKACQLVMETTGVRIPKCYDATLEPNAVTPMESKFSFLFEDYSPVDGWYQQWLLQDVEDCEAALSTFAKIHAFFWNGASFWEDKEAANELEAGVWQSGSYVQPKAQNTEKVNQCKVVAKEWATKRMRFEKELSSFDYWDNLGERLESVAEECGRLAHPFAYDDTLSQDYQKYRTFTHGDPKQANLLFKRSTDAASKKEQLQVGLIDFQWAGFGLAASDIAHFLTSAVHADRLVNGGEETLMRFYFDKLQKHLVEFGAYKTAKEAAQQYSYDTFVEQYEIAVLDICRLMIAYTWDRFDEPVEKDDAAGCARTMNKTSYNKSIPTIVWLLNRCDAILKSRGV